MGQFRRYKEKPLKCLTGVKGKNVSVMQCRKTTVGAGFAGRVVHSIPWSRRKRVTHDSLAGLN